MYISVTREQETRSLLLFVIVFFFKNLGMVAADLQREEAEQRKKGNSFWTMFIWVNQW